MDKAKFQIVELDVKVVDTLDSGLVTKRVKCRVFKNRPEYDGLALRRPLYGSGMKTNWIIFHVPSGLQVNGLAFRGLKHTADLMDYATSQVSGINWNLPSNEIDLTRGSQWSNLLRERQLELWNQERLA